MSYNLVQMKYIPIAVFVSLIKSEWLLKFLNKLFFRYSAVRDPPWPKKMRRIFFKEMHEKTCQYEIT
jgi:hypothetical protein